jgi:hypothetical protein
MAAMRSELHWCLHPRFHRPARAMMSQHQPSSKHPAAPVAKQAASASKTAGASTSSNKTLGRTRRPAGMHASMAGHGHAGRARTSAVTCNLMFSNAFQGSACVCRICFEGEDEDGEDESPNRVLGDVEAHGPSSGTSTNPHARAHPPHDHHSSSRPHSRDNPLISPCLCTGGSRYVHRRCLQQWRAAARERSGSARSSSRVGQAHYRCEVCGYEYQYVRIDRAACIRHPAVVPTLFVVLLAGSCWLLGYVPIIQVGRWLWSG